MSDQQIVPPDTVIDLSPDKDGVYGMQPPVESKDPEAVDPLPQKELHAPVEYVLPASPAERERDFINHTLDYHRERIAAFYEGLDPIALNVILAFISAATAVQQPSQWEGMLHQGLQRFKNSYPAVLQEARDKGHVTPGQLTLLIPHDPTIVLDSPPNVKLYLGGNEGGLA